MKKKFVKKWGVEDRQAFADGNILRASTVPDARKKRSKAPGRVLKQQAIRDYMEEC